MLKFIREKHRITVDPISLSLEPLMKIWLWDRSEDKAEAVKLLTYIHLASQIDQSAPYAKADPSEVARLVKREVWRDYDHAFTDPEINEAFVEQTVLHYQSAYELPEEASVRAFEAKIHEINKLIEKNKIEIEKTTSRGTIAYVSNFTIMNKMMQDITKITKARDELKALIIKQTTRDNGIKGAKKISFLEKRKREMSRSAMTTVDDMTEPEPEGL